MPKPYTFPTLYDELLQISIAKLSEWNYLVPNQVKTGTLTWSCRSEKTGSIEIKVNMLDDLPYILLKYSFNKEPRQYKVNLVSLPSNLGKGVVWYFQCPKTSKRCRKLYSVDGYFLHRDAFNGCMYDCQTQSKYIRTLNSTLGAYFKTDEYYDEINNPYFKRFYNGKLTKRYEMLLEKIKQASNISPEQIEWLLMK